MNYGHTFGHVNETLCGNGTWLNGEAVAIGMVAVGELSLQLGAWRKNDAEDGIREEEEETGLAEQDLNFIWESKSWFFYDVPKERRNNYFIGKNKFIGQRQKWFLAEIKSGHEKNINLSKNLPIEFDDFIWVTYWYPLREVVSFKKEVYRELLIELLPKYIEIKK